VREILVYKEGEEGFFLNYEKLKIIRTILPELLELDGTPFLPVPKDFSWEELENSLLEKLRFRSIHLVKEIPETATQVDLHVPHFKIEVQVGPLMDPVYALFSKETVEKLSAYMLGNKEPLEEGYLHGFKDFLIGMAIQGVEKLVQKDGWTLKASDVEDLKGGPFLKFAVEATIDDSLSADLIVAIPKDFLEEWREHYVNKGYQSFYEGAIKSAIELPLSLEIGEVILNQEQFNELTLGDFICLDRLLWLPNKERGRTLISHQGTPLFLASVKAGGLKIIEHSNHYEVGETMAKNDDENLEDLIDDDEVEESEESQMEDEESEIEEEEEKPTLTRGGGIKPSTPSPVTPAPSLRPAPPLKVPSKDEEGLKLEETSIEKGFSLSKTDVVVKVEIGRLKMALDKLTELEPGNILKLNVNPENGVNLVVNEKVIGRGELVSIGDLVGVRIIDLGS
jgi:flagellar motor switch protein FliN/FliY